MPWLRVGPAACETGLNIEDALHSNLFLELKSHGGGRGSYAGADGDMPVCMQFARTTAEGHGSINDKVVASTLHFPVASMGLGGGRGKLASADGDLPVCLLPVASVSENGVRIVSTTPPSAIEECAVDSVTPTGVMLDGCDGGYTCSGKFELNIITWNAAGMDVNGLGDLIDLLEICGCAWDALLIQEGPRQEEESLSEILGGHLWYVAACGGRPRSIAILLHRQWTGPDENPRFRSVDGRLAVLDVCIRSQKYCFMSCHLPHAGYSDIMFEAALAVLEETVAAARVQMRIVIVGIDANAVIGSQLENDVSKIIGPWGLGDRNERGLVFAAWLHLNRLSAANTIFKKALGKQWTHQMWSSALRRQIDYVLVDTSFFQSLQDCEPTDLIDVKSDHRGLCAVFAPAGRIARQRKNGRKRKTIRGYALLDEGGIPAQYHRKLDEALAAVKDAEDLAEAVVNASRECDEHQDVPSAPQSHLLQDMLQQRAGTRDPVERKTLSKQIWKRLRLERQQAKDERLDMLLQNGKGASELAKLLAAPVRRKRTVAMTDSQGNRKTNPADMAEVFASFYEQLYNTVGSTSEYGKDVSENSPAITANEIAIAIKKLKNGRTCGDDGLLAEMLKTNHQGLLQVIALVFTDILHGRSETPASWNESRLVVLYKKGDASLPKNYRPIAIISVLNKLFSGVLLARVKPLLESLQAPEQAGFRPDFSCSDVVHFLRMVSEKSHEWGLEVWAASLDLEKAFDKVSHESVFYSLCEANVDPDIIRVLCDLYRHQEAYVQMDKTTHSRSFSIKRGVRQGDPLSPILFNNVTRLVFAELRAKWKAKGFGVDVGRELDKLTHVMFADDTTLLAATRQSLTIMISDVHAALARRGLNLNLDKCLIQTNRQNARLTGICIDEQTIPMVAATVGFKILGTIFTLSGRVSAEIRARMAAAWGKFHQLWPLLGKRDGNIHKRLRLFDTCVSQTLLWCSESWLLTQNEKRLLRSTQNHMLRRIAGPRRAPDELWIDWIKRSTPAAKKLAAEAGIRFWISAHLRSKWSWAGHVVRMDATRLARRATEWRDSKWQAEESMNPASTRLRRPGCSRWFRWEDELKQYAAISGWSSWQDVAMLRDCSGKAAVWASHCDSFVSHFSK